MRQTVLLARQAAEVDVLSGGRLRLGLGAGWVRREYEVMDQDYNSRGRRLDEQITVLRALWCEEATTFHGQWHHLEEAGQAPRRVQQPIPIWVGGTSEAALRRAATTAGGWIAATADEEARAAIARLRALTETAGRQLASVGIDVPLPLASVSEGSWQDHADTWRTLGATHLTIDTLGAGLPSLSEHLDQLRRIKAALDR